MSLIDLIALISVFTITIGFPTFLIYTRMIIVRDCDHDYEKVEITHFGRVVNAQKVCLKCKQRIKAY